MSNQRTKIALAAGALVIVLVSAALTLLTVVGHSSTKARDVSYSAQIALPFTALKVPVGIAVDGAGNNYVADYYTSTVWKLAAV